MALSRAIARLKWKTKFQNAIDVTELTTTTIGTSNRIHEAGHWLNAVRKKVHIPLPSFQPATKELTTFHRTACKMASAMSPKTIA